MFNFNNCQNITIINEAKTPEGSVVLPPWAAVVEEEKPILLAGQTMKSAGVPWRPEDEARTRQQITQWMMLVYASLSFLKDPKPAIIWGAMMTDFTINWNRYADQARNASV